MRRVVITGMGAVTPLGADVAALVDGIENRRSGVRRMPGWEAYRGLRSLVAAPAEVRDEKSIPRRNRRSMGRMSFFAVRAAEEALADAVIERARLGSGRVGCAIGSTMGGAEALSQTFETMSHEKDLAKLSSMKFFQCLAHTAAMNVSQYLGITGMVLAPSGACASSLQALGIGYDLIKCGRQDIVLCGGSEEVHPTVTAAFDILYATSTGYNEEPQETPRPFDKKRDGLVCGEGCGIVVLEELEHARARGAAIHGEVVGFHTCASGDHVSESSHASIERCLRGALEDAAVSAAEVDYVNAHATATRHGDAEEARAIAEVFGDRVPVSAFKGYIGHTLGASGAIELIAALVGMRRGVLYPTLNLQEADDCGGIRHVLERTASRVDLMVKNSFAFGGINASLVCRRAS